MEGKLEQGRRLAKAGPGYGRCRAAAAAAAPDASVHSQFAD